MVKRNSAQLLPFVFHIHDAKFLQRFGHPTSCHGDISRPAENQVGVVALVEVRNDHFDPSTAAYLRVLTSHLLQRDLKIIVDKQKG